MFTVKKQSRIALSAVLTLGVIAWGLLMPQASAVTIPDPKVNAAPAQGEQSIVLAGGCFWGIQAVFQHVKGVRQAVSGYAGGTSDNAQYELVSTGTTGHAESVQVTYDPAQISLGQILKVYFSVAHNPTQLNRQGPDSGTQYRSAIFYSNDEQKKVAQEYIAQLQTEKLFGAPIVTKLEPLSAFYPAEDYHQDYARNHPDSPYIVMHDLPKVENLHKEFPALYVD